MDFPSLSWIQVNDFELKLVSSPSAKRHLELLRGLHEAQPLGRGLLHQGGPRVDQEVAELLPQRATGDGSSRSNVVLEDMS